MVLIQSETEEVGLSRLVRVLNFVLSEILITNAKYQSRMTGDSSTTATNIITSGAALRESRFGLLILVVL
ncbi:MAG: hypothetical protein ABEI86_12195, partial [Halobacteriaceae archaeon]